MTQIPSDLNNLPWSRRGFLKTGLSAGGMVLAAPSIIKAQTPSDTLNVALIGVGSQGRVLLDSLLNIEGLNFQAVCDIWDLSRRYGVNRLKKAGFDPTGYEDIEDLLAKETGLDAVIIATPDFWHAPHTNMCLKAGINVYCEKMMAHTVEAARSMVVAQRESGKLLQIGHQRRSNPRYQHALNNIINKAQIPGRITNINGQWNRAVSEDLGFPKRYEIPAETLKRYGFRDMHQFRNWRWFKGLGGGPIVDLGSHQIDIYSWFLEAQPKSVMASGGVDYWTGHEWYDTVTALLEYETKDGMVRASYRTLTTNSNGGYFEQFMGDRATLDISESGRSAVYREVWVPEEDWYPMESARLIKRDQGLPVAQDTPAVLDARSSPKPPKYNLLVDMNLPFHQPHLENFFNSIRGTDTLNCPGEIGYETAVAVLKINEAVEAGRKLEFKPEDFHV